MTPPAPLDGGQNNRCRPCFCRINASDVGRHLGRACNARCLNQSEIVVANRYRLVSDDARIPKLRSTIGELLVAVSTDINDATRFRLTPDDVPHAVGGASGWVSALDGFAMPPLVGLSSTELMIRVMLDRHGLDHNG